MLENMLVAILSMVFLLMVCKVIMEHVLSSETGRPAGKTDCRTFLGKVMFAYEWFCREILHTKDFRKIKLEEGFGGWKND